MATTGAAPLRQLEVPSDAAAEEGPDMATSLVLGSGYKVDQRLRLSVAALRLVVGCDGDGSEPSDAGRTGLVDTCECCLLGGLDCLRVQGWFKGAEVL